MIRRCSLLTLFQSDKYRSVHYCPSTTPFGSTHPLLPEYQSYWYPTVHLCTSTRPALLILYSPPDTLQSTTAPVPDLLIQHIPLLLQYESYWYPAVHYYPISCAADMTKVTVPVILICSVHNCPSTSPTDTTQSAIVPVPELFIQRSQHLP